MMEEWTATWICARLGCDPGMALGDVVAVAETLCAKLAVGLHGKALQDSMFDVQPTGGEASR
jgi:hypothetical protein